MPLDDESIRLIEQLNPGTTFDWPRILKGQGTPATEPRPPMEARRTRTDRNDRHDRRERHEGRRGPQPSPPQPAAPELASAPGVEAPLDECEPTDVATEPVPRAEEADRIQDDAWLTEALGASRPEAEIPAHAKLGEEGVQRLRTRYVEILTRIAERSPDPSVREELKGQAERLNPDAWLTGEDVVQGLEQYESVLASLRDVVGQRRRRRRGRGPRSDESAEVIEPSADAPDAPAAAAETPADPGASDPDPTPFTPGES